MKSKRLFERIEMLYFNLRAPDPEPPDNGDDDPPPPPPPPPSPK